MAHYAFLDENNIVTHVIVGKDENEDGIDWEQKYGSIVGQTCKRTSYNTHGGVHVNGGTPFRKNYAGVGMIYNEQIDGFTELQPYSSWSLDNGTGHWQPPVPCPDLTEEQRNSNDYCEWNEENQEWNLISGS